MPKLGTYWTTRYSMVSEQTCTIDYEMDHSMWQTTLSFDILHPSHMWIQTVLLCGKYCLNNADRDCFKTPNLQEMLRTQNLRQVCAFLEAIRLFQSVGCVRNKLQVRTFSTESEIISLDAGLRLDGIPALDSWDLIVAVLGKTNENRIERWDPLLNEHKVCSPPHTIHKRMQSQRVINDMYNVDFLPSNVQSSHQEALLYIFEDNEAVIKIIIKGTSPTMRHVSRTHRVALDWWLDRITLDSKIQIKYIDTEN